MARVAVRAKLYQRRQRSTYYANRARSHKGYQWFWGAGSVGKRRTGVLFSQLASRRVDRGMKK
ncbi:hypothetical protein PMI29_04287 [Pseudomonas sp. GM49]|nr:hypothetical protein PMI29_04287 [Pseudomonas sp. GM49]